MGKLLSVVFGEHGHSCFLPLLRRHPGGGTPISSHIQMTGVIVGNFERTPKRYQNPGVSLEAGYRRSTAAYDASCRRLLIKPSGLLRVYLLDL